MTRVPGGVAAVLHLDGERRLAGHIESGDGAVLTVVLPALPRDAHRGARAVVEYASPHGMHRVHGRLTPDPERAGVVHLARDGGAVLQRREWARVEAARPVRLAVGGAVAHVYTRNLSAGGMLVQDPFGLAPGEEVAFALQLVDGEPRLAGRAPVTDVREDDALVAIRLNGLADGDRERIVRWATERQRHALRIGRRP